MYIYYLLVYTVNIVFDAFLHDLYMLVDVFKQHKFHVTIIFNYIYEPTCIACKLQHLDSRFHVGVQTSKLTFSLNAEYNQEDPANSMRIQYTEK